MSDHLRLRARRCALTFGLLLLAGAPRLASAQAAEQIKAPPAVADSTALNPGPWGWTGKLGVNLAQSAFSPNWKGGDTGSFAWTMLGEFTAERQLTTGFNWSNRLAFAYGQTARQDRTAGVEDLTWQQPAKSTDLLRFESLARWTGTHWANPFASIGAETQFLDQSSPIGTIHLNPIKVRETVGMVHVFDKSETREFITRLGVGARETFAKSFVDPVTKETASFTSTDGGIEWQTTANQPISGGKITYRTRLLVFAPLFYSSASALEDYDAAVTAIDPTHTPVADYWRGPDVDWTNAFTTKVTKVISVDLFLELIYDKFDTAANVDNSLPLDTVLRPEIERNIRLAGQFKQTLGLGISANIF
jgi:hypothetical protein